MAKAFEQPIYVTRPLLPDIEDVTERLKTVWDSRQLTNFGKQHDELSRQLKTYLEVGHISMFSNGTLALLLGLKALKLTGEVITTPFTFPATVQALDWNNLTPVFCDIDPVTFNIDADKIEALITEKTSAILAVHVFGNPCEVEKIQAIADKHGLKVIYDGAHAFGSKINGVPISSFGDMTMFSFHATKLFNTIEGGALAYSDPALDRQLDLLRNFGIASAEEVVLSGLNAKMNEVQAGVGLEVLKVIEEERHKRHAVKKAYEENLAEIQGIRVLTVLDGQSSSYQYFVIEIDEAVFGRSRNAVHKELQKYNVFARKYFYPLCSDFDWYSELPSARPEHLPHAQQAVQQVLAMPYYGDLPISSVAEICGIIRELYVTQKSLSQI
ncbi:dTDP-4-amino-4,6-dideoxygalactose transaminase [Planomicrobium stackebrandtii]|uniref:dTDP-4-amino-4,6-dideoxygalactose transaminase n=1 Tax=Planomicrobium stackebrandtii TaxID=253160 RepID=A0ABU0GU32_9BACL|nr:DegT/DnrJ/EryC1/StrS family aminotransferase [Planomicrobium stackebrandtii]MDQ0428867.1 dTDP-4-amino-4,6-dideoxygalactose transaminase [Planomicrobium stackebrandtii]